MLSPMPTPLLAAKADVALLRFPLLASPKIDGIRALVKDGVVYARSGKPIPNAHVQQLFGKLHGFDGELVVGEPTAPDVFRRCQSGIMSKKGEPDVRFFVFDWWNRGNYAYGLYSAPYSISKIMQTLPPRVVLVEQNMLYSLAELDEFETTCLAAGFEGVMLRNPDAGYKQGRSTVAEGILLKVKRFAHAEAEVLHMEEQHDALGCPNATLGALHVRDLESRVCFNIGTGFTQEERDTFWQRGQGFSGTLVRYRYFPTGSNERPRFPVFAGVRHALDMGNVQEVAHA